MSTLPSPFREAVAAIDAGDLRALTELLDENPELARDRVEGYGEGYFHRPYLLWFVAGNPVRSERLPPNIAQLTRAILERVQNSRGQIDYALGLVCSGRVPRESDVQRELIDVLCDAGADPNSALKTAVAHVESGAVHHLLERGAHVTLLAAIATGNHAEIERLADIEDKQTALMAAALFGDAQTIALLIERGADIHAYGPDGFHSHATPLHQAVYYGSLDAVRTLVDAGAKLDVRDRGYDATPLEWAEYAERTEIAAYLSRSAAAKPPL